MTATPTLSAAPSSTPTNTPTEGPPTETFYPSPTSRPSLSPSPTPVPFNYIYIDSGSATGSVVDAYGDRWGVDGSFLLTGTKGTAVSTSITGQVPPGTTKMFL
eukprot:CAMPEP_0184647790 /NCGR_PEP_ID=MMETSP0308-20130426/4790_1 /TAXON_ID=38269 /ORGANISM="Gloeochaete witrockiana, Strain SAG 46.84" /LENGTH=102 /DNA_ID=CAMNT_0027079065 /DNA_START=210 /DNA_END=514 /DNA_ORIENTATION=+